MAKLLLKIFFIFMLFVVLLIQRSASVKWLGFWDYVPQDLTGWSNLAFTDVMNDIIEGKKLGFNNLYTVEGIFFTYQSGHCTLNPTYKQVWEKNVPFFQELLKNQSIFGFFLGDELVWNGLPVPDLLTSISVIRNQFPNAVLWTNEASGTLNPGINVFGQKVNYILSKELSWFSVDIYHMTPKDDIVPIVRGFYENFIYPKLLSNQSAVLVPGAFSSTHNPACNFTCMDQMCANDAYEFYNWASKEPRIIGIAPWHWLDCSGCVPFLDEIGTKKLNYTRKAWQDIGKKIIQNSD